MSAGSAYSQIATTTLGSATSTYTFSNIPSIYTNLVLIVGSLTLSSNGNGLVVRYNGDTGNNYSYTDIGATSSATFSRRISNSSSAQIGWGQVGSQGAMSTVIAQFPNYVNNVTFKTAIARWNDTSAEVGATVSLWRNTSPITSITVLSGANLQVGTTLTLYGITGA
jgi:hypothetical protein